MTPNYTSSESEMYEQRIHTPYGEMTIWAIPEGLILIDWSHNTEGKAAPKAAHGRTITSNLPTSHPAVEQACRAAVQLTEYFSGSRKTFDLPLIYEGTPFQMSVWKALSTVRFAQTRSYLEIAQLIGNPAATRAVGQANRKNPFVVVLPCHRVIGANGGLVGYAGTQTDLKANLLQFETSMEASVS